ncbi:hypothetical protein ACFO1V_02980 [Daeguia caeni]|uniref:Uncharacterized protein n=1 Tax=Daeguia caeni TaxID=439612 RepID=A0ABV9H431_9HYPH
MNTQSLRIHADTRRSRSKLRRYIEIHEQLRREVEAARMSTEIIGEVERVLAETDFSVSYSCADNARHVIGEFK